MPGSLVAGSLYRVRVRVRPGIRLEEWLRQSAHPLGGVDSRGRAQYPAFAPNTLFCSQIFRNGSWVFGLSVSSVVKNPPANEGNVNDTVSIPGSGRSPGRGHGNPRSILAQRIPQTEEPGGLQFRESQSPTQLQHAQQHTCLQFAPAVHAQLSLIPCDFFAFCCQRRYLPRCKHCKESRSQPVSIISTSILSTASSFLTSLTRTWC